MPKILSGVTISIISGHGKFTNAQVSKWASRHSGRFSHDLNESVTHVLCNEQDYKANGPEVKAALNLVKRARKGGRRRAAPLIVTEDWLEDSLTIKGRKQKEGPYLLESIIRKKRAIKKKAQRVAKEEANGDRFVNGNMYDVWADSTHFEYKVKLDRTKEVAPENQQEHYILYLFQSRNRSPPLYFFAVKLFSKKGDRNPKEYRPSKTPQSLATEMAQFEKFFMKKTGVEWDERLIKTTPMGKGKFSYVPPSGGKPVGEIRDQNNIPEKYVAVFQAAGLLPTPAAPAAAAVDTPTAVATAVAVLGASFGAPTFNRDRGYPTTPTIFVPSNANKQTPFLLLTDSPPALQPSTTSSVTSIHMAEEKRTIAQLDRLSLCPPTPPQTTSPNSPTPSESLPPISRVEKIIAELRNRCRGQPQVEEEWWCIHLSVDEFNTLEAHIEADEILQGFVADKIRYDYFPSLAKFVLRMAGPLHEAICGNIDQCIIKQLQDIEQGNNQITADFARGIRPYRAPKITDEGCHAPDGSFAHRDATRLGIIIEVSHSQKRKDLLYLADDYILGSNGLTQLVIGIDLEYRENKGKEAKVMIWRPRDIEEDGKLILEAVETKEGGIFRAKDGSLVDGKRIIRIGLKDFGNPYDCPGIDGISGEVTISFSQLYDMLQESEVTVQNRKRRKPDDLGPPGRQKRPRVRSPPEELYASDEKRIQAVEEEANRQVSDQDSDYAE